MNRRLATTLAVCIVFTLAAGSVEAMTSDDSTLYLLKECTGREPRPDASVGLLACLNYLDGLLSMHQFLVAGELSRPMFCLPSQGLQLEEVMRVFVKFAEENPTVLHESKTVGAVTALTLAYPCP